jgi:hypothetical protein
MQKSLETVCLQKLENRPFVQMIQIRGPEGGIKCVMATITPIRNAEHPIMMEYGWYEDTQIKYKNGNAQVLSCVNYLVLYKNDDIEDQHEIYGYRACMDGFHCKHNAHGKMERFELCDSYAGHMSAYRYLSHIMGSPLYEFEEPLETYYGFKPMENYNVAF